MSEAKRQSAWAVILGVSSGTGAAVARALAHDPGLDVFGMHRGNHPDEAAALEADVRAAGRRIHLAVGDAGTAEAAERGAASVAEIAGARGVRVFVHSIASASVGLLAGERRLHPKQVHKTFDAMAHSFLFWIQELLARDLLAPGSQLLALSNWTPDAVLRGAALVAASKATLSVYARYLARELGPLGHRVNVLSFGGVVTPALRTMLGRRLDRFQAVIGQANSTGRMSTTDEVARFVSVLAGEAAGRINGATIDFTGGEQFGMLDAALHPNPTGEE